MSRIEVFLISRCWGTCERLIDPGMSSGCQGIGSMISQRGIRFFSHRHCLAEEFEPPRGWVISMHNSHPDSRDSSFALQTATLSQLSVKPTQSSTLPAEFDPLDQNHCTQVLQCKWFASSGRNYFSPFPAVYLNLIPNMLYLQTGPAGTWS